MTMSHYDASGNEVRRANYRATDEEVVYDLAMVADHGLQPDFDKDDIDGKLCKIGGIDGPEDFPKGPVYFVLLKRWEATDDKPEPEPDADYIGVMFPATSAVCTRVLQMAEMGALPFMGVPRKVPSKTSGNDYWRLDRPDSIALSGVRQASALPKGNSRR